MNSLIPAGGRKFIFDIIPRLQARIAQLVWQLVMGQTAWVSNPGWGQDFPRPSRLALGPTQPPIKWVLGLPQGYSGWSMVLTTHPHRSDEVKERVELSTPLLQFTFTIPRMALWPTQNLKRARTEWESHLWLPSNADIINVSCCTLTPLRKYCKGG